MPRFFNDHIGCSPEGWISAYLAQSDCPGTAADGDIDMLTVTGKSIDCFGFENIHGHERPGCVCRKCHSCQIIVPVITNSTIMMTILTSWLNIRQP